MNLLKYNIISSILCQINLKLMKKLTIAKNKPNKIEITEGNIKCSELNIESSYLNLKLEHSDLNLKSSLINFVFYDKIVQRIDIAKRNMTPDDLDIGVV